MSHVSDSSEYATPLKLAPELLPELLALFPDVLLVIDQAGMITHLNREAKELFGAQATELPGRPLEILIPARFRAQHMRAPHTRPMGAHLDLSAWRPDI